jgi:hypothetical protein
MPVDFFETTYKSSTSQELFGLCDDNSTPETHNEPAYLSEDMTARDTQWIAEVSNLAGYHVDFYPIDNIISFGKGNGKCDCMLHYDGNLIFVELKERTDKAKKWKKDARDQLSSTIAHFKQNHCADDFNSVKAHICNKLRPMTVEPSNTMRDRFADETGCILHIGRNINL